MFRAENENSVLKQSTVAVVQRKDTADGISSQCKNTTPKKSADTERQQKGCAEKLMTLYMTFD